MIILVVGLLIFGSRLPEVGRSLGRGLMEFKKGLRGVQDELTNIDREADDAIDAELQQSDEGTRDLIDSPEDLDSYDPSESDLEEDPWNHEDEEAEKEEVYDDDPSREPGPEWGGDPQPDAGAPEESSQPSAASSAESEPAPTTDDTTVYADPDYFGSDEEGREPS